jgi:hypothetical protein
METDPASNGPNGGKDCDEAAHELAPGSSRSSAGTT